MNLSQHIGFAHTPPLWDDLLMAVKQFDFPKLKLEDKTFDPVPQNLRLGHQMEYVFKQLIQHSSLYDVVLHNLPISIDKITIGEIDFILRKKATGKLIHIELTYKFYILDESIADPIRQLMGPNRRDDFYTKLKKIKNKQFPLLHSEQGALALAAIGIDHQEIEHQCCFKAKIFTPYRKSNQDISPLNSSSIVGEWLRLEDFTDPKFEDYTYYLPYKREWVIDPQDGTNHWVSYQEAHQMIRLRLKDKNAPMVWIKINPNVSKTIFVVWW